MLYWVKHQAKYAYAWHDRTLLGYERSTLCPQCGRPVLIPKFSADMPDLLLEGPENYPDFLQFTGAGRQLFLVSERTLELFEENHISGYSGSSLIKVTPSSHSSRYYKLNIIGSVDLDYSAMHLKKKKLCPHCNQFEWNRMRLDPMLLDDTTWDGSDLCCLLPFPGFQLCSPAVKELVERYQLTGLLLQSAR